MPNGLYLGLYCLTPNVLALRRAHGFKHRAAHIDRKTGHPSNKLHKEAGRYQSDQAAQRNSDPVDCFQKIYRFHGVSFQSRVSGISVFIRGLL